MSFSLIPRFLKPPISLLTLLWASCALMLLLSSYASIQICSEVSIDQVNVPRHYLLDAFDRSLGSEKAMSVDRYRESRGDFQRQALIPPETETSYNNREIATLTHDVKEADLFGSSGLGTNRPYLRVRRPSFIQV